MQGPSDEQVSHSGIHRINVTTAEEMYNKAHQYFPTSHIAIFAAAVADYRPKNVSAEKIKKKKASLVIELEPTKDILASLGLIKQHQFLVGFALETTDEEENAIVKLERKNLDAIVLNSLRDQGAGFTTETNKNYIH